MAKKSAGAEWAVWGLKESALAATVGIVLWQVALGIAVGAQIEGQESYTKWEAMTPEPDDTAGAAAKDALYEEMVQNLKADPKSFANFVNHWQVPVALGVLTFGARQSTRLLKA
jgi:hypothetical protein